MAEAQEVPPKEPKILPKEVKAHVSRLTTEFLETLGRNPYFTGSSSNPFRVRGVGGRPDSASFEEEGSARFNLFDWEDGGAGEGRECYLEYNPVRQSLFFWVANSLPRGPGGVASPDEQWVSLSGGGEERPPRLNYSAPAFPGDNADTRFALGQIEGVLSALKTATAIAVARQSAA